MTLTDTFIDHVESARFEDFDERVVTRAKRRLLDSVGVIAAGKGAAGNAGLIKTIGAWGGAPESTVFFCDLKLPAVHAAVINSVTMRSFDFEAIEAEGEGKTSSPAHISGTTVPTALAMAEKYEVDGKTMLTALLLGEDLACRLATAGDSSPFNAFWDNTGTFNCLGATVAAGRIMGLNASQMRNALGIALNQLGSSVANIFDNTMAFKLPIALSARNAIFSAELAAAGFTAAQDALGGKGGYFDLFTDGYDAERFLRDLGKTYYADVVIKPYSACRATHPAIDCARKIYAEDGFDVAKVCSVKLHLAPNMAASFIGGDLTIGDVPQISGAFSAVFTTANALVYGTCRPEHFTEENMRSDVIQGLLAKTELLGDLDPSVGYAGAALDVVLVDGTALSSSVSLPFGDVNHTPQSDEEIFDKYYSNVAFGGVMSKENADEAKALVMDFENLKSIDELTALMK